MGREYQKVLKDIVHIDGLLKNSSDSKSFQSRYLLEITRFLALVVDLESKYTSAYFSKTSLDLLREENGLIFAEEQNGAYQKSFSNPEYSSRCFGDENGPLFAATYVFFRTCIKYLYRHDQDSISAYLKLFMDFYSIVTNKPHDSKDDIISLLRSFKIMRLVITESMVVKEEYLLNFYHKVVTDTDLGDPRYLFRIGHYVSDSVLEMARFLHSCSTENLANAARVIVSAYDRSFKVHNKDKRGRTLTKIIFHFGQEIFGFRLVEELQKSGYKPFISEIINFSGSYKFDHRFDESLFIDSDYIMLGQNAYSKALKEHSSTLANYAGFVRLMQFGESPLSSEFSGKALKLNAKQSEMLSTFNIKKKNLVTGYIPGTEISYTGAAFPSPSVGENFHEIFNEIMKINMMDSSEHEKIQQIIIDALDSADYVHIQGKSGNLTNIKVKMNLIKDSSRQTNFCNCGADINLPFGEVFTTPVLEGTEGLLHVSEVFHDDFRYLDLKLSFRNGYITDFSCNNSGDMDADRQYILNTLLFPYKTLPMGEFAIGTNTYAYMIIRKLGIMDILPGLIAEKMGPHFAVGDTCFAWAEDQKILNVFNGKEMIARENEKTGLRKNNPEESYVNTHTDITIPYEKLGFITVVTKHNERKDIIRNGLFVLEGTEMLNEPLLKKEIIHDEF